MKIKYRPEIDGLRAIAVVAVILYHAQITIFGLQPFKGGFIGVDIFFVISGYLITSIILKELVTTGTFSFKYFYERRIRRILPVLLFVMLASLPFAWMYLMPSSFVDFSKSILYSLGFSSNFYFHYSGQIYGAESGDLKPFLHAWSLSVEEQFYILFPIVLLITFKYFRKYLLHILLVGFVISLVIADWGGRNHPSFNFYFLLTRVWELVAGSILAYFEINSGHRSQNQKLNLILPIIGLLLIGHSILFFKDGMFHPSFHTLLPITGVCLIIWFSNEDELITKILSSKLFVGIGLISYSLYFWHYPIFAFDRITEFTNGDITKKILLGVLIFFVSIFSYFFIEIPARNKQYKFKYIFNILLIIFLIITTFNFTIIFKNGFKNRFPEFFSQLEEDKPWRLLKNSKNEKCYNNKERCVFNTSSKKRVYIVGDSHMGSIMFDLKDKIVSKNYQFITSTRGGCIYYPGFNKISIKTNKINKVCNNNYFLKLEKIFKENENSFIIFGGAFPVYLTNYRFNNKEGGAEGENWGGTFISIGKFDNIQSSFKNSLEDLSKNHKIILIYPIPEVGRNVPRKFLADFLFKKKELDTKNYITTSYKVYKDRVKSSFELLDSIQGDNIYRVYPHKIFCDTLIKDRCVTHDDKNVFYADDDHPSIKGSEMINDLIMKEIEKIEAKSN